MPYLAKVFTFWEGNDDGCIVRDVYLKEVHVPASDYEEEHVEYQHFYDPAYATYFETREKAQEAIRIDTAEGNWARWHDSTYWPRVKQVLSDNNLWGAIEEVIVPNH